MKTMGMDMHRIIREFIETNFLFREGRDSVGETESLLEAGLIDSTGVLELVAFVESQFSLTMADEDIVPENLDSVGQIAAYVQRRLATRDALTSAA